MQQWTLGIIWTYSMSRIEPTDKPPFGTHANSVYSTKFCNEEYRISASNISCSTSDIQSYVFKQDILHVFFYCRFLLLSASTWAIFLWFEIHWLQACTKFQREEPVAFLFIVKCYWHCPKSVNGYLLGASFQHWHASIEINTRGHTMTNFHASWYVMVQKDVWQLKASVLVKYDMFCRHSYPGCDGLWLSWMFQNEELESRHGRQ